MNTTFPIRHPEIAVRIPARPNFFAILVSLFNIIFATADDPAALRYVADKYGGEID
jgi:hypothetical protein